ncbi:MAG: hypothetical protein A3G81_16895 [Betaproteobacteria bacterium RIFCSPLOWO2_12_FULL_65_14]|nr:MAG: hypothetical protein A3G81_16895 [Betaproteobacteria bacterium RIFCSPLOWO2_12_FULL_65_14]
MGKTFVFNGDADGLCALQQLHLDEGVDGATLITGPKRRTALVREASAAADDEVTVLDLSFDVNREAVDALLCAGARVRYFDHHHAASVPTHPALEAHIDPSPTTCTSAIIDRYLDGRERAWAIVGAFGDNFSETANRLASTLALNSETCTQLERLGLLLNYNSYGEREEDLFFPPAELHRRLSGYRDPLAFVREEPAYRTLSAGHDEDMQRVQELRAIACSNHAAVYVLPDASWARRVSGVLANRLARTSPASAHAVLSPNSTGGMQVSVRAPLERPTGAAAFCLAYSTGGGREAAAGINHLPIDEVAAFAERFLHHFAA